MKKIILILTIILIIGCQTETQKKYCNQKNNVHSVHECGELIKIVSSLEGGGVIFEKPDGTKIQCPVVALETMTEECQELIYHTTCGPNIC